MTTKQLLDPHETPYNIGFTTEFTRILKADNRFIIAGYASPKLVDDTGRELPDMQGDAMDLNALDEAFRRLMKVASRRNLIGYHSNIQIGELLWNANDSDGVMWKSHVIFKPSIQYPKKGLFIVAELFDDVNESMRYRKSMQQGNMLMFSIGGEVVKKQHTCSDGVCRDRVVVMDLHEVSSCHKGVNPEAKAFILKTSEPARILAQARDGASLLKLLHGEPVE